MVLHRFIKSHPSISFTSSLISLAVVIYVAERGLTSLNPDSLWTSVFYFTLFAMVSLTLIDAHRKKDVSDAFLVRANIFLWFSTAFLGSRLMVRAAEIGSPGTPTGSLGFISFSQVWIGGYHLHHYLLGLLLITASNLILLGERDFSRIKAGMMFGAGLGLLFDEIGFLLSMGDYSSLLTYPLALLAAFLLFLNVHWY